MRTTSYILITLVLFLIGCTPIIPEPVIETVVVTETVTETVIIEDTDKIEQLEKEIEDYENLVNNLNKLLSNVYYVYQKKSDGSSVWGTGFSIGYKDKFYLITAGHAVKGEYGYFPNLGFRANFSNEWIYPELLTYNYNNRNVKDYAIFYSDKVNSGFKVDNDEDKEGFVLGSVYLNLNTIRIFKGASRIGESGSPIIDFDKEIIGINTDLLYYNYTPIKVVLKAIDDMK